MKHILVTTDLSPEAIRAFRPVGDLARLIGARITVLHVLFVAPSPEDVVAIHAPVAPEDVEQERTTAEAALEEHVEGFFEGLDVALRVEAGPDVARVIANYADENDVDLIALSTHGRSGLRRLVLGSVAERLLRYAHAPVLCFTPDRKTVTTEANDV